MPVNANKINNTPLTFLLIVVLLFFNCKREEEDFYGRIIYDQDSKSPLVTFLYNSKDTVNVSYNKHIKKTINYTKIPYQLLNYSTFNDSCSLPKTTRTVVVTNTDLLTNKAFKSIVNFTANGGTVFLPISNTDFKYRFLAGIKPNSNPKKIHYADGFKFITNIIPGLKNKTYSGYKEHQGYKRHQFNNAISVLATAVNDTTYPTIIKHNLGKGHVIAFNSKQPALKADRGLYFSALLSGLEGIPYPIVNVSSLFLDDFPAPTYHIKKEPVLTEYNITHSDFYNKVWWPDMIKLAEEERLKYTAMVCFDYGNNNNPPFLFNEWNNSTVRINKKDEISGDYIIKNILKTKHELAFHGYNHTSLMQSDWPNFEYMTTSLKAVSKKWKVSNYGNLPVTYVPPSNHIDQMGFQAIQQGMPSIKYNCSLYLGHFNEGGEREYDYEPYNNAIFNFPRITSGYTFNSQSFYDQFSLFLYTGIWSHFIHPDDVYQIKDKSNTSSKGDFEYRNINNLGWKTSKNGKPGMLPIFATHLKYTKKLYPLLRFLKTKTAASYTKAWRYSTYEHDDNKTSYEVASQDKNLKKNKHHFWFMYATQTNLQTIQNDLNKQKLTFTKVPFLDGFLLAIQTEAAQLKVPKLNSIIIENEKLNSAFSKKITTYKTISEQFKLKYNIDYNVANGNIDEAIDLLKDKIDSEDINSIEDWKKLYTYLGWKGRQFEIWPLLNTEYQITLSISLIDLSLDFVKNSDYPNLETRHLWLNRQINAYPNDKTLKSQYEYYFPNQDYNSIFKHKEQRNEKREQIRAVKNYINKGHLKQAWIIASALPPSSERQKLKQQLNKLVLDSNLEDKKFLFENYPKLLTTKTSLKIKQELVTQERPFLKISSGGIADKSHTIALKNTLTTGFYSYKKNKHELSVNKTELYPVQNISENNVNSLRKLTGLQYGFQTKKRLKKPYFKYLLKLEKDQFNTLYYGALTALTLLGNTSKSSIKISHEPVINSASYGLKIYQSQLALNSNFKLGKRFYNYIKSETNYYSDNEFNTALSISTNYLITLNRKNSLSPVLDSYLLLGQSNKASGYPYWTLKKRMYYGGGLNYTYKNKSKDFIYSLNSKLFYDDFYGVFLNFNTQLKYPVFNYFYIEAVANYSSLENIYQNNFNLELTYYLNQ